MFRLLLWNTGITVVVYFLISVIGLWTTGLIAKDYGIISLGIVTITRLFLPTGLISIFDLGAPENASFVVAQARSTGKWEDAKSSIITLLFFSFTASCVCAFLLWYFSPLIIAFMQNDAKYFSLLENFMRLTAAILPFAMPSLVCEGVLKGFERYTLVRGIELFNSGIYSFSVLLGVAFSMSLDSIVYMALIASVIRSLIVLTIVIFSYVSINSIKTMQLKLDLYKMWERTCLVAPNKILSTIQTQSAPLIIGFFLGAADAGIYEILTRIPRFLKSFLGLINSVFMPFASRLVALDDRSAVGSLNRNGIIIISLVFVPFLVAIACLSRPILMSWVDKQTAGLWAWHALAMIVPLVSMFISFGANSMFGDKKLWKITTLTTIIRLILQYTIAFIFMSQLQERAFILGNVLAVIFTAIFEYKYVFLNLNIDVDALNLSRRLCLLSCFLGISCLILSPFVGGIYGLLFAGTLFIFFYGFTAWFLILPGSFKDRLLVNLVTGYATRRT